MQSRKCEIINYRHEVIQKLLYAQYIIRRILIAVSNCNTLERTHCVWRRPLCYLLSNSVSVHPSTIRTELWNLNLLKQLSVPPIKNLATEYKREEERSVLLDGGFKMGIMFKTVIIPCTHKAHMHSYASHIALRCKCFQPTSLHVLIHLYWR
jgi:hypothetical protein